MPQLIDTQCREILHHGVAIPAHPLALNCNRRLDERRQRALSRYYIASGAGGLAVGVHTTQFAIHDPKVGLYEPVIAIAAEEMDRADRKRPVPLLRIAGICGSTAQAVREAQLARELGYQLGLLNLGAFKDKPISVLLDHCRVIGDIIPLFGFYLQPAAGGVELCLDFWRGFCSLDSVSAIKIASFDRYITLSIVRAVIESGRDDIALYTGNDDNIVCDLVSPFQFLCQGKRKTRYFSGGLLGQWAVWTSKAVNLLERCRAVRLGQIPASLTLLADATALTDANAAIFDVANNFCGCVPGIHEVLRRQGLLVGNWCLNPHETLSPGQQEELDRVLVQHAELKDDSFVAEHLDEWLRE